MKIIVDGTNYLIRKTGIGVYTYHLIKYLQKYDNDNQYSIFYNTIFPGKYNLLKISNDNFRNRFLRIPRRYLIKLWESGVISSEWFTGKADIFITTGLHIPKKSLYKLISFVYDVNTDNYPDSEKKYLRRKFTKIVENAEIIISTSKKTKYDIVKLYGADEQKIKVIYGSAPDTVKQVSSADIMKKYSIPENYFLFLGTIEYRKNLEYIMRAFKNSDSHLVIAGKKGDSYEQVIKLAEEPGLKDRIFMTGYIEDSEVPLFYKKARALIYTSRYEGFGFPVLESFYCGTPVITSREGSIPELGGDAAVYVDDIKNPDSLTAVIKKFEENKIDIEKYKMKMKDQLLKFSWDYAAQKLLRIVNRLS